MARIRTIKPQHVNDKELATISLQAHLFWILSWCFSDDDGVIENDPILLKSQIFPRRQDIRVEQISQWIDQLVKARFVIPFTHNGDGYLLHRTFGTHQKIDRPQPSKIPADTIRRILDERSTNGQPCIVKESKGEDSKGEETAEADPRFKKLDLINPFSESFLDTWIIWKNYKKAEFKFLFKSIESEQAALNDLVKKANGEEETAAQIIHQSMANGWKGFFHLKKEGNGQSNTKNGHAKGTRSEVQQVFNDRYSQK
jgi:hypothetical protein